MHWGLVAATTSMDALLDELGRHTGEFTRGEAVGSVSAWNPDEDTEEFALAVGERDGRTYLLDTSFMLSDMPDALVAMSHRLGLVVGGGAETVSGSWWLTVARDGELLRFVFRQHEPVPVSCPPGVLGQVLPADPGVGRQAQEQGPHQRRPVAGRHPRQHRRHRRPHRHRLPRRPAPTHRPTPRTTKSDRCHRQRDPDYRLPPAVRPHRPV